VANQRDAGRKVIMNFADFNGQTLDDKYRIERELGKGGMGTVYLATHVGTERPVAVKIIAPQFMERAEFVERFRREARAAGRLRHPNVVNVTDFGFAATKGGEVAYLVMEYLDGCTLGEILEEEGKLPLAWSLDILEQVCSAVHEAHAQGIIHRDLKPDNIWLEPNQRGGYTVKVLDFGIAKLEEHATENSGKKLENISGGFQLAELSKSAARATIADSARGETVGEFRNSTQFSESATIAQIAEPKTIFPEAKTLVQAEIPISEDKTVIFSHHQKSVDEEQNVKTQLFAEIVETDNIGGKSVTPGNFAAQTETTKELTRVGAVLGTPLFMSPEQCRGEKLSTRSDIYSLGVIAYRMLSGKQPFDGNHTEVMTAHQESAPPLIETKKIPRKIKKVIYSALAKNETERPATAEAFASKMRSYSEGVGSLLQRSLVIYSENLQTFVWLAFLTAVPSIFLTLIGITARFLSSSDLIPSWIGLFVGGLSSFILFFTGIFFGSLLVGMITWLVSQRYSAPLRPISWRPAFEMARHKWRQFAGTVTISSALSFIGLIILSSAGTLPAILYTLISKRQDFLFFALLIAGGLAGLYFGLSIFVKFSLVSPVVMMEDARGFAALKRSNQLVKRSYKTALGIMIIYFVLPLLLSGITAAAANSLVDIDESEQKTARSGGVKATVNGEELPIDKLVGANETPVKSSDTAETKPAETKPDEKTGEKTDEEKRKTKRLIAAVKEALFQILWIPLSVFISSFSAVTFALLYLKTRLAGGESWADLLKQFETADRENSKWQQRVRERLLQSGRMTSKT
jgi:serine/threonine protein kinase